MENKTIGIGTLVIFLLGSLTLNFLPEDYPNVDFTQDVYYCESNQLPMNCPNGFSKYVSPVGKCLNDDGNTICREGWVLLDKDITPKPITKQYKEVCDVNGCTPII